MKLRQKRSTKERFEEKFSRGLSCECWLWNATRNNKGYGMFYPGTRKNKRLAHRISYELYCGPILEGQCVLHKCDNPECVNPAHLFVGSMQGNYDDMVAKGRRRIVVNPDNRPPRHIGSSHPNAGIDEATVLKLREMYASGVSQSDMRREFGLSKAQLRHALLGHTWRHVGGPIAQPILNKFETYRGEAHANSKLTAEAVRSIRTRHASGELIKNLAREFGVTAAPISEAIARKTWRHVK